MDAAGYFELAAVIFEELGEPMAAAEAALELGRCALFLKCGQLLQMLAGRLVNLAREEAASLPVGGIVALRVWAAILGRAESEPLAFFHLIQARRRIRRDASPGSPRPANASPGDLGPSEILREVFGPPEGIGQPRFDDWPFSGDEKWFVRVIEDSSPAARIESGQRILDLGRRLGCPARWRVETRRVVVRVAADHRGHALINALREEARRAGEAPS